MGNKSKRTPPRRSCWLLLDQDLLAEYDETVREASQAAEAARFSNDVDVQRYAEELADKAEELKQQAQASRTKFTFRGLGRRKFAALLEKYPPNEDDKKDGLDFDPESFAPALIKACIVDPVDPPGAESWEEVCDDWTEAEVTRLFETAYACNRAVRDIPFSAHATGGTQHSAQNSTTAPD